MEYLNKSKICREFLNQYSDSLFPELLPKLMKVAIYALHKTFHKWNFSLQELDEFINFFNYKNRNFELESNYKNNCPCPPCEEYLEAPRVNKIQRLNMGFRPPEGQENQNEENGANDCYGFGKFYPNDDVYINEKNNFYDENYYIPRTHSYRNIQLYHRRLTNPKFITQEKKIYPHWWWNLKDDIEQDDYSEDDSDIDHVPSRPGRFPKHIEDKLKHKVKRHMRNKSVNPSRPITTKYYDESKIFPNTNITNKNNDLESSPYIKRDYSPSDDESHRPYGGTASDGFNRPFNNNTNLREPNTINNNINMNSSPLYSTSPNLNYRGPLNDFGRDNRPMYDNNDTGVNNSIPNYPGNRNGNQNNYNPNNSGINNMGFAGLSNGSYLSASSLAKTQILNKRFNDYKKSTLLSFDKDFNLNGAKQKVKGQIKNGLKYSLCGNQLKEDKKGIRRRQYKKKK